MMSRPLRRSLSTWVVNGARWPLRNGLKTVERALFQCTQKPDESNDSFLARADIMWSELLAKNLTLKEIQAYIVLRGSQLSGEDKKRVLVESGGRSQWPVDSGSS